MDYTQATYLFRARKAARYVSLYGLSRTLVKIRGQYHMKAADGFAGARWTNASCVAADSPQRCVALIGCGNYSYSTIAYYLRKYQRHFLRLTYDRHQSRAMSLCKAYGGLAAVADWREILADPLVRVVFIASNHASHAEFAVACIEAGKHVHIEKPHVVDQAQLEQLAEAMRRHPQVKVFLGFNRPKSRLFRQLQAVLATQEGPLMVNWFVGGHETAARPWYFNAKEGGVILGNLCHWSDLTLHLVSLNKAFPCQIVPASSAVASSDVVVSFAFADGSCAAITFFSAKEHAFEGVRETLNVRKGSAVANLTDFQQLTVDLGQNRTRVYLRHRDHGHGANIVNSLQRALTEGAPGEDPRYVVLTARFFLAIREAVAAGKTVVVSHDELDGGTGEQRPDGEV